MGLMGFVNWLKSLAEPDKSAARRPVGMSRRCFLRALGVGSVTVCMGGVLLAETPFVPTTVNYGLEVTEDTFGELIEMTLRDLGRLKFQEIVEDLQKHQALRHLITKDRLDLSVLIQAG
jgi:hypothetical protein